MSKMVNGGIVHILLGAVGQIKHGKPVPTIIGALVGGGLGAFLRLVVVDLMAFGIGLGVLIGATVAASIFRRPGTSRGDDE